MTNAARVGLALVAAVALVVALVLLSPSDEAESPATTQAGRTDTQAPAGTSTTTVETRSEQTATTPVEPEVPTIRVRAGGVSGRPEALDFEAGDDIVFRIQSSIAEEVHIHGYDRYVDLQPGRTTTVSIPDAELEGAFEVELHGSGEPIALLRVSPS